MFKILLITFGTIFVSAILISYLTFFVYIRKKFITSAVDSGTKRSNAKKIWRRSKRSILRMSYRIVFRGGK